MYVDICPLCKDNDMSLNKDQFRFTEYIGELIKYAYVKGYTLSFGDAYATTGHIMGSRHYERLAVDFCLFKDGKYLTDTDDYLFLGEFWKSLNPDCTWGGDFQDGNHFSFKEH